MAELLFRQGTLSQLFNADGSINDFKEGSLNFTTDEPAIYFDFNNQRLRIGDIREFDSINEIENYLIGTQGQIPSSGLYYAKAENVLMKFDKDAAGTDEDPKWKQINLTAAERTAITSAISALNGAVETAQKKANDAYELAEDAYELADEAKQIADKAILKDGTVKMEADLDVNNNKIVSLKAPTVDTDAANKKYVDDAIKGLGETQNGNIGTLRQQVVLRDGTATLTGDWNINANDPVSAYKITGLPTPANDSDAVNKSYVDNKFKVADAMQFKGVVNSADDLLANASNIEAGWTYKVGQVFSFGSGTAATKVYVGDLLIANADASDSVVYSKAELGSTGATWSHVSSGYETKNASYLSYEDKTLYLDDIQDGRRGSITFMDNNNVKSNISAVEGESVVAGVASHINVGFKLEWGTFSSAAN